MFIGCVDNMGTKDKRCRTKYNTEQLAELERLFCQTQYPDSVEMEDLADKLNVSTDKISIWFQNRRSKFKRQSKDTHISWMRKQIFNRDAVTQPSSNVTVPNVDERTHVLSPPDPSYQHQDTWDKPSSNLHYLPTMPSYTESVLDLGILPPNITCGQPSPNLTTAVEQPEDSVRIHCGFPPKPYIWSHRMAAEQQASHTISPQLYQQSQLSSCMYSGSFPAMYYYPTNFHVNQFSNMAATQSTVM